MTQARFIVLEGGEGAGKSTQISLLAAALQATGLHVTQSREPGGAKAAEIIRAFLKGDEDNVVYASVCNDYADGFTPGQELLLFNAARIFFLKEVVTPALSAGRWLLSDRFIASTMAYQGYAGGLGPDTVGQIITLALGAVRPDLTIILDVPVEVGTARRGTNLSGGTRFEDRGEGYHQKVRQGYLHLAKDTQNYAVLDASPDIPTVHRAILAELNARFGLNLQPQA